MGRWFANFLNAQGYSVTVADPSGRWPVWLSCDWRSDALAQDIIVVATQSRSPMAC